MSRSVLPTSVQSSARKILLANAWASGVAYNELHQHPTIFVLFNNNSARNAIFTKTEAVNAGVW